MATAGSGAVTRGGGGRNGAPAVRRGGFSIVEMLMVVIIISVLTSIVAPTFQISSDRRVHNMALQMAAELEMARARALSERRLIRVQFDPGTNRYAALMDHDDDGTIGVIPAEVAAFPEFGILELDDLVVFGRGSASTLPGDPGTDPVTLPSDQLDLDKQAIPSPWGTMGTIYLTHSRDSNAVAAVSVASSGAFKAWRWFPAEGVWR